MKLSSEARDTLRANGVSVAGWTRRFFGEDAQTWRGAVCGCPDDRCIYHHHEEVDECNCLPALLADLKEKQP